MPSSNSFAENFMPAKRGTAGVIIPKPVDSRKIARRKRGIGLLFIDPSPICFL